MSSDPHYYDPWQDPTRPEYWEALWADIDWHRCSANYWDLLDWDDD